MTFVLGLYTNEMSSGLTVMFAAFYFSEMFHVVALYVSLTIVMLTMELLRQMRLEMEKLSLLFKAVKL